MSLEEGWGHQELVRFCLETWRQPCLASPCKPAQNCAVSQAIGSPPCPSCFGYFLFCWLATGNSVFFGILRKFISFILSKPKSSLFRQLVPFQVRWLNLFCRKIFSLQGKWELVKVGKITLQRFSDIIFLLFCKPKTGLSFMSHNFHIFTKFQKQKVFNKHFEQEMIKFEVALNTR